MPDFSQVYKMFKINVFNVDFGFNDVYNLNNSYQIICAYLAVSFVFSVCGMVR